MKKQIFHGTYDRSFFMLLGMVCSLGLILSSFYWQRELDLEPVQRPVIQEIDDASIEIVHLHFPKPPSPVNKTAVVEGIVEVTHNPNPEPKAPTRASFPLPDLPTEIDTTADFFVPIGEYYPIFPGGDAALLTYLSQNTRYTSLGREFGIQGIVYLHFVVQSDGSIANVTVLRGLGYGLDEEAMRVVRSMPRWQPGYQGGKPVDVAYMLPIRFTLK